ncbi:MAG: FG-GAP repeat protein [Alphaproteobacteria bacterium]|nr:FG-GAP repeat protein [Alphaproteobacteria bacterium]
MHLLPLLLGCSATTEPDPWPDDGSAVLVGVDGAKSGERVHTCWIDDGPDRLVVASGAAFQDGAVAGPSSIHFVPADVLQPGVSVQLYDPDVPRIFDDRVASDFVHFILAEQRGDDCAVVFNDPDRGARIARGLVDESVHWEAVEVVAELAPQWPAGPCGDVNGDGELDLCFESLAALLGPDFVERIDLYGMDQVIRAPSALIGGSIVLDDFAGGVSRWSLPVTESDLVLRHMPSGYPRSHAGLRSCGGLTSGGGEAFFVSGHMAEDRRGIGWVLPVDYDASTTIVDNAVATLTPHPEAGWFGFSCDVADMNGDGEPDLLVGSPGNDSSDGLGRVYLFEGPVAGTLDADDARAVWTGPDELSAYGISVAAGDFDDDGVMDLAIGAPYTSRDEPGEGAVHVLFDPLAEP